MQLTHSTTKTHAQVVMQPDIGGSSLKGLSVLGTLESRSTLVNCKLKLLLSRGNCTSLLARSFKTPLLTNLKLIIKIHGFGNSNRPAIADAPFHLAYSI
jgi:hypothetical protein